MYKKENTRSGAASPKRESNCIRDDIKSNNYNTTNAENQQGFIAALLPHGEANAISSTDLQKLLGLSDKRCMRRLIERERINGAVICSSDAGYFLPSEDAQEAAEELRHFIAVSDARCKTNRYAIRSAKLAFKRLNQELSGQEVIPDA